MSTYTAVESIFVNALQRQAPAERAAYLAAACGDDADLRAQVERLLAAHPRAVNFLEQPAAAAFAATGTFAPGDPAAPANGDEPPPDPLGEQPGESIGPYKLLQKLGEGGMGAVWVAEQQQPVRRRVALKLIKPGMDSRQVITRFEQERQALALMDHTHIAKVLDAGTTPQGRPYFVMELVKGVPITKYCDELHLSIRERLELFVPVCQAVQHAHQKGVIHRDLKPSNVLVAIQDGKPVPKIIDFGVAKALHTKLAERTLYTEIGAVIGTLEYMAPEQAELSALDIDTRADVYALGVLLYELLTGSTPLDRQRLRTVALDEVLRLIREEEPQKPSTRLTQSKEALSRLAAKRRADPRRLGAEMRGELDWIVMKALEKDRTRRYETANGFARDVQRYLADEAVEACPPSAGYRLRKFVRRNKGALLSATVLVVALLLVLGTAAGSIGYVTRDRAARRTEAEREQAARQADAERERAVRQAETERAVEESLREAEFFRKQSRWPEALAAARKAAAILKSGEAGPALQERVRELVDDLTMIATLEDILLRKSTGQRDGIELKQSDTEYAAAFQHCGIDVDALSMEEAAERIRARPIQVELAAALDDWALSRSMDRGAADPGTKHLRAVVRAADPDPWRNRVRDAMSSPRQDRKAMLVVLADKVPVDELRPVTLILLGYALNAAQAYEHAAVVLAKAQRLQPDNFWMNHDLAWSLMRIGGPRLEESLRYYTAAMALRPRNPVVLVDLAEALQKKGALDEAIAACRKAIDLQPDYALAYTSLGAALWAKGQRDEADAAYREGVRRRPDLSDVHFGMANHLRLKGAFEEAIAEYREALRISPSSDAARNNLGLALRQKGLLDEAISEFREALRRHPDYVLARRNLGITLLQKGALDESIAEFREVLRLQPTDITARGNFGLALTQKGLLDEAITEFREVLRLRPNDAAARTNLITALGKKGLLDEAIAEYREVLRLKPNDAATRTNLINALRQKGLLDEVIAEWREVVRLQPNSYTAHNNLGVSLRQKGFLDEAIAEFREALRLRPNYVPARGNLGLALRQKGLLDEAIAEFREILRVQPNDVQSRTNLGMALGRKGAMTEAIAEYREALRIQSSNPLVQNNLAWIMATCADSKFRDPAQAVQLAQKATELAPQNGTYWNTLGAANYRTGNWNAAITALNKSTELRKGGDSADFFFLAMAHWQLGEKVPARQWYDKAVQWMDQNRPQDDELRRFRAEAGQLLGIDNRDGR